jgi:hypothetical protein
MKLSDAQEAPADVMAEIARLKAELARVRSGAETLGKIVISMRRSMEAARIEDSQNGANAGMQWILNSIPDVDDDSPADQWNGTETAAQWLDRQQAADRAWAAAKAGTVAKPCDCDDRCSDCTPPNELAAAIGTAVRAIINEGADGPCCTGCSPACACGGSPHGDQS